jgi:DNA-binding beta-propeller fold protein YncE
MTFGGGRLVGSTGDVIAAATLTNVGVLAAGGTGPLAVAVDGARTRVYACRGGRVYAYDLSTLLPLGDAALDLGGETARRLIRWGSDGLAVITDTRIVLVRGALVSG